MKRQFSAGIITYHKENGTIRYVLLHYPGGHWDFPKGKIEKGENKQQTAVRELKEETELDVAEILSGFEDNVEYFFRAEGHLFFKTVSFLLGRVETTKVVLSHEHQGFGWFDYKKAYERLTYQNSKDVLEHVNKFLKGVLDK